MIISTSSTIVAVTPGLAVVEADGEVDDAALDDEITEFEKEWLLVALGLMYEVALGLTSAERHSAPGSL